MVKSKKINIESTISRCIISKEPFDKCVYVEILPHLKPDLNNIDNLFILRKDLATLYNDGILKIFADGSIYPEIEGVTNIYLTKGNIKYIKLRNSAKIYFE